jgi:hypothetical protein
MNTYEVYIDQALVATVPEDRIDGTLNKLRHYKVDVRRSNNDYSYTRRDRRGYTLPVRSDRRQQVFDYGMQD